MASTNELNVTRQRAISEEPLTVSSLSPSERELISLLRRKNEFRAPVRKAIDGMTKKFVVGIRRTLVNDRKRIVLLGKLDEIPDLVRDKVGELLVEEEDAGEESDPNVFVECVRDATRELLCEGGVEDNYRGLDCDRDPEEKVEMILKMFPEVLSKENEHDDWRGDYPISLQAMFADDDSYRPNLKAVSFIPLMARIAID